MIKLCKHMRAAILDRNPGPGRARTKQQGDQLIGNSHKTTPSNPYHCRAIWCPMHKLPHLHNMQMLHQRDHVTLWLLGPTRHMGFSIFRE